MVRFARQVLTFPVTSSAGTPLIVTVGFMIASLATMSIWTA